MPAKHPSSSPPTPDTEETPPAPGFTAPARAGSGPPPKPGPRPSAKRGPTASPVRPGGKGGHPAPAPAASPAAGASSVSATPVSTTSASAASATSVGRIPVLDVRPVVREGRRPAKAVVGETFEVTATVFREGHDAVAADVVLTDPEGRRGPFTPMRELAPGTDRWGATVTPGGTGHWTYTVEAWGDPVTTWRRHARIKIPAGMDTELVLEEGARLHERAAAHVPDPARRAALLTAVDALRDARRPASSRLAGALVPEVDAVLARYPLRELVTASDPMPLLVERERALYGSWYE
ncbi:maltotransferase domain-containing protein, partial [Streptomyces pratens]